jgi:2'-5' RNA ligase
MPTLRLFIAIETPTIIIPKIAAIRDQLRTSGADVKWEPDEKLHATLKFLGNANGDLLPDFVYYLRGVAQEAPRLTVRYKGIGCFPNKSAPRVVWIGMDDLDNNLIPLQKKVDSGFARFGFEKEDRTFHPHVTLGRVKGHRQLDSLLRMTESTTFESEPVELQEITLVRSDLRQSGSIYTTLNTFPLGKQARADFGGRNHPY